MDVAGLPLHPLVVHAAVVFGPLAALTALAYVAVPRWSGRVRGPMVALAVVATLSIVAAFVSGNGFLEANPRLAQEPWVAIHQDRAGVLLWLAVGFGLVALAAGWLHDRPGMPRTLARAALGLLALAVLVQVVLVGDAGARAVWEGV